MTFTTPHIFLMFDPKLVFREILLTMQFLNLLLAFWISIPTGHSQPDLFFPENFELDPSLHLAFDPTLLVDEPRVGETNSLDVMPELNSNLLPDENAESYQMTEPEMNWFLDDDVGPNPITGSDTSSFLTDNIFCDAGDADDGQLFGKIRRRDSCSSLLVGQAPQPGGQVPQPGEQVPRPDPNRGSSPNLEQIFQFLQRPVPMFEPSLGSCPSKYFGLSNTPVCEVPGITNIGVATGQAGSSLEYVYSGMLV